MRSEAVTCTRKNGIHGNPKIKNINDIYKIVNKKLLKLSYIFFFYHRDIETTLDIMYDSQQK